MKYEGDDDTSYSWSTWNGPQRLENVAGRFENWRTNQDHPDYSTVENIEKSSRDLSRLAVT